MSDNPKARDHIHPVFLSAPHYLAIAKLMGELGIGKSAALELTINRGLFDLGALSKEDFELFDLRYRRKLVDIINENKAKREDSHLPKLELEKKRKERLMATVHQVIPRDKLEGTAATLRGMLEQWEIHTDLGWRIRTIAYAKGYPDNEFAKLIIAKEKECDNISQEGS